MARLEHGPIVASASGRIGRIVIRQTRFGPVAQTAHDPPAYQTEKALAAKARFRTAQNAWSIMPTDLSDHLRAFHREHRLGIPGPWTSAMLNYMGGQPFDYKPATNPEIEIHITSIVPQFPGYIVNIRPLDDPDWYRAFYLYFHPTDGVDRSLGWTRVEHSGTLILTKACSLAAGAHIVVIPNRVSGPAAIGRGDAYPLP
ncbi:hypothetical protein ES703_41128 [subsurface metagenome]